MEWNEGKEESHEYKKKIYANSKYYSKLNRDAERKQNKNRNTYQENNNIKEDT